MQTFTKAERLCSKVLIERVYEKGKSINHSPFKISWHEISESAVPIQVVISVPKRIFKRAVDRNRLKRMTREAFRKNKKQLSDFLNEKKVALMIVYTSKKMGEYAEIERKIIEGLQRLAKEINPKQ